VMGAVLDAHDRLAVAAGHRAFPFDVHRGITRTCGGAKSIIPLVFPGSLAIYDQNGIDCHKSKFSMIPFKWPCGSLLAPQPSGEANRPAATHA
jgi:hypothetical protein